jgi:hypothetical protein
MNCLEYRRVLLAGQGETEAMRAHRLQCAFCGPLLEEHVASEGDLQRALEIPVPAGYADRLAESLRAGTPAAPIPPLGRRRLLAAGTAVAVAASVMEEEAKSIMMGAMPRAETAHALAETLPLERIERIGRIRHIAPCPFNGETAYHVILSVPQDKVTLLVMPHARFEARKRAVHDGLYASVVPLRKGSVGVIGTSAAVVDSVAGALRG